MRLSVHSRRRSGFSRRTPGVRLCLGSVRIAGPPGVRAIAKEEVNVARFQSAVPWNWVQGARETRPQTGDSTSFSHFSTEQEWCDRALLQLLRGIASLGSHEHISGKKRGCLSNPCCLLGEKNKPGLFSGPCGLVRSQPFSFRLRALCINFPFFT